MVQPEQREVHVSDKVRGLWDFASDVIKNTNASIRRARADYLVNQIASKAIELRDLPESGMLPVRKGTVFVLEEDDHGLRIGLTPFEGHVGFEAALRSETGDSYGLVGLALGNEEEGWNDYDPRRIGGLALGAQAKLLNPIIHTLEEAQRFA